MRDEGRSGSSPSGHPSLHPPSPHRPIARHSWGAAGVSRTSVTRLSAVLTVRATCPLPFRPIPIESSDPRPVLLAEPTLVICLWLVVLPLLVYIDSCQSASSCVRSVS